LSHSGPSEIGPYQVLAELGRGGLGAVYRARNPRTGGEVAIKVLLQPTPEMRERFKIEARAAAQLRHPNLVPVHDLGWERDLPYLVMELVEGESLAERLKRGALPPDLACRYAEGIAKGLAAAHGQRILPRDIKPGNVMIDEAGVPRITDFGLARLQDASGLTRTGTLLGTPAYAAPEQIDDASRAGPPADVYAVGATLYEMLSGEPPFGRGKSVLSLIKAVLRDPPPPLSKRVPELDPQLAALCMRCLSKVPEERPDAAELARELAAHRRRLRAGTRAVAAAGASKGHLLLAAGIVALGLVAAAALMSRDPQTTAIHSPQPETALSPVTSLSPEPEPTLSPVGAGFTPALTGSEPEPLLTARELHARELATRYAHREYDAFVALLKEVRSAAPQDPLWLCTVAYSSSREKKWEEGLPTALALLDHGVQTGLGCKLVAGFLVKNNEQTGLALELLERAWRLEPVLLEDDDFFHHYGEAVRLSLTDDPVERARRLRWSIDANRAEQRPNRFWHIKVLANALQDMNRGDEAVELMQDAFREDPDYPANSLHLGDHLLRVGRKAEAAVSYQRVVDLIGPHLPNPSLRPALRKEWESLHAAALRQLKRIAAE